MKLRLANVVVGSLVVASLGANGYLFSRWRSGLAKANDVAGATVDSGAPGRRPGWNHPPVRLDGCGLRAAQLQSRMAELVRLRDKHLPPSLRWEQSPINEPLTAALRAELGKNVPAGAPSVRSECREHLCRVFVAAGQNNVIARFMQSEWRNKQLRALETDETGVLLQHLDPNTVSGNELLQTALHDFESSGAIEKCQASFKGDGDGTLDTHLSLAAEQSQDQPPAVAVSAAGPLVGTPLGKCIDGELRKAMAALTLPPKFDPAEVTAQFPRP